MTISEDVNLNYPKGLSMMSRNHTSRTHEVIRRTMWVALFAAVLFAFGCGSDSTQPDNTPKYPTGISDDIEQQLKYDARVDNFEADGDNLTVNVNDGWMHSPAGMRERTLGQWYSMWQSSHKASKIVVKFQGNDVETFTADKGYQPVSAEKKESEG